MELELRSHFQVLQQEDFIERATSAIKSNQDALFFWAILSAAWDEISATAWTAFMDYNSSYASAWLERYKTDIYPKIKRPQETIVI